MILFYFYQFYSLQENSFWEFFCGFTRFYMVRKKARRKPRQEEDPMAGTTNLTDAMLVLALGFLIFAVVGWNLQSVVFSDMTQEEKQDVMESISNITKVTQGEKLNSTPDTSDQSGEGYVEQGKVYKDSKTGELIMVES